MEHTPPTPHVAFAALKVTDKDCQCGVKFGAPLKWFRTPQFCFKSDCCFHDFLYSIGGSPTDRLHADEQLYWDMKHRIDETKPWWQRPGHKLVAWIYYRAVRQFGDKHFYRDPRRGGA